MKRFIFLILVLLLLSTTFSCKKKEELGTNEYSIHTNLQNDYLKTDYKLATIYANGKKELSYPVPIKLTWDSSFCSSLSGSITYEIKIYEDKEKTILVSDEKVDETFYEVYNLKIAQEYYWEIVATNDTDTVSSNLKEFKVIDDKIRNLYIDGVTNVRDLGGYLVNGKRTKQGLIYRTSKLNDDESTTPLISEKGIDAFNKLGVKTEIDLRKTVDNENGGINYSLLGNNVKYYSIPMVSNGNCLTLNPDEIKQVFSILGNKNNYPLFFHCSIGTDRTGMVAFLINSILGVNEDNLYRDYLFSNFGQIGSMRTPTAINNYLNVIKACNGNSLQEKTYQYLLSIGVDKNDIDNLIEIMW